jgi:hypothetical protein
VLHPCFGVEKHRRPGAWAAELGGATGVLSCSLVLLLMVVRRRFSGLIWACLGPDMGQEGHDLGDARWCNLPLACLRGVEVLVATLALGRTG